MLRIVEPTEHPAETRTSYVSLAVSVLAHAALALVLWFVVYSTVRHQSVSLTGSASKSADEVSVNLATSARAAEPVVLDSQPAVGDSGAASKQLISEAMRADALSEQFEIDVQPPSVDFFGTRAFGNRFVFVLDISYSMDARDGKRFRRACDELIRSVSQLRSGQSYYVFLFCWRTPRMYFNPEISYHSVQPGHAEKLGDWIYDVSLGAGTDPRRALALAREMDPDAVFLLSDGQFNKPGTAKPDSGWIDETGRRLDIKVQEGVEKFYRDIPIHTIAFENPFTLEAMQKIAETTGGRSRYVPTGSHKPISSKTFLNALSRIEEKHGNDEHRRDEILTRLTLARDLIHEGELVYAEYLVRPVRDADESEIINPTMTTQVLNAIDVELGAVRLEDFELDPKVAEALEPPADDQPASD